MKAFITSIGEPTTELCKWSLERNGFDVTLIQDASSLAHKLKWIYEAALEFDFIRVDADVVPNRNCTPENVRESATEDHWWVQFRMFDWFQQDIGYGGIQYIKRAALPYLRDNVGDALDKERPETYLSRIKEFNNPRRFISSELIMGVHNYRNDIPRVMKVKARRGQFSNYDFDLAKKLEEL